MLMKSTLFVVTPSPHVKKGFPATQRPVTFLILMTFLFLELCSSSSSSLFFGIIEFSDGYHEVPEGTFRMRCPVPSRPVLVSVIFFLHLILALTIRVEGRCIYVLGEYRTLPPSMITVRLGKVLQL